MFEIEPKCSPFCSFQYHLARYFLKFCKSLPFLPNQLTGWFLYDVNKGRQRVKYQTFGLTDCRWELVPEAYLEPSLTSRWSLFAKIVNG